MSLVQGHMMPVRCTWSWLHTPSFHIKSPPIPEPGRFNAVGKKHPNGRMEWLHKLRETPVMKWFYLWLCPHNPSPIGSKKTAFLRSELHQVKATRTRTRGDLTPNGCSFNGTFLEFLGLKCQTQQKITHSKTPRIRKKTIKNMAITFFSPYLSPTGGEENPSELRTSRGKVHDLLGPTALRQNGHRTLGVRSLAAG